MRIFRAGLGSLSSPKLNLSGPKSTLFSPLSLVKPSVKTQMCFYGSHSESNHSAAIAKSFPPEAIAVAESWPVELLVNCVDKE